MNVQSGADSPRKATIDIDTGGTFTDGFATLDGRVATVKVETTPHDLTVCFNECLEAAAQQLGLPDASGLLRYAEVVRYATTIGTNTLLQRNGPKLGLLVSRGYEKSLYALRSQAANPIFSILPAHMVVAIDAEMGADAQPITPIQEDEVKRGVKQLLEQGARMIVVSLKGANFNPALELQIRDIVNSDYPKHYLGSVPMLLGHQVSIRPNDASRTNAAVLNAYLHKEMVRYLYKADDDLRNRGYTRPLLIVHANGGAARVAKTRALSTYNSGPVAGLLGSDHVRRLYNLDNVVTLDVGGTSSDISLIADGRYDYNFSSSIHGIPVDLPMIEVHGVGAGGSSIAAVEAGVLRVGPESAGSMPGPACFSLGGLQPTGTDAFLTLGFIDPDYFLGGRRRLDREAASKAIAEHIASPLAISVEEAAARIKQRLEENVGSYIRELLQRRNLPPGQFAMFAFGGAGGLLAAGIARSLGIETVYTFPFSSVFCAFGSSMLDVAHHYERPLSQTVHGADAAPHDFDALNGFVDELCSAAYRDMRGEGFPPEQVHMSVEIEVRPENSADLCSVGLPRLKLENDDDVQAFMQACREAFSRLNGAGADEGITLETLRLKASAPIDHYGFHERAEGPAEAQAAQHGRRDVWWDAEPIATQIYRQEALQPGSVVQGPAIVEAPDTTILAPSGATLHVDKYGNGVMKLP